MKESEKELLIRIDERTLATNEAVAHLNEKFDKLDTIFVKKNDIRHIVTAYYLVSRVIVVGLASGILYMICSHAKSIKNIF